MTCTNPNCQAHVVGHTEFTPLSPEWTVLYEAYKTSALKSEEIIGSIIGELQSGRRDTAKVHQIVGLLVDAGYEV